MAALVQYWCILLIILQQLSYCRGVWTGFDIVRRKIGGYGSTVNRPYTKISGKDGSGPQVPASARFGSAVANIGDLDGNGYDDIIVGAPGENSVIGETNSSRYSAGSGAVYILFMGSEGEVMNYTRISSNINGGPLLNANDNFGTSVAKIGDLDDDGIDEIAVGAPGIYLSQVVVFYMHRNGTVRHYVRVRGKFINRSVPANITYVNPNGNFTANGPDITYQCRFGTAVTGVGDLNNDGIPDIAASSITDSSGVSVVYILFLNAQAKVINMTQIRNSGAHAVPFADYDRFGVSLVNIGDIDRDGVTDMAVGAKSHNDASSGALSSGAVYVLFMNSNGTVKSSQIIAKHTPGTDSNHWLDLQINDFCGASVTSLGDINQDNVRQHYPDQAKLPGRPSINDVVFGCPQTNSQIYGTGKLYFTFLNTGGKMRDYTQIPNPKYDNGIAPTLEVNAQFGASLGSYMDLDETGIKGLIVGAPGDSTNTLNGGAVYLIFTRRRRYHPPVIDLFAKYIIIAAPLFGFVLMVCAGIAYFFYYFRRKPDEIEKIVKQSGMEISSTRTRKRREFKKSKIYAEEYV